MPQPVRFRAPASRGASRPSGAGVRAALLRAIVAVVLGGALTVPVHAQQVVSGQIYIAGPGDRTGADAASMNAMMQSRAGAAAPAVRPAAPAVPAVPAGMISIPGPGEKTADHAGDAASAPNVITIPGPGERPAVRAAVAMPGSAGPTARAVQAAEAPAAARVVPARASVAASDSRVTPVVVEAQPAGASAAAAARGRLAAPAPATIAAAAPAPVPAQPAVPPGQQDGESIRAAALAYLQQQSAGLPGRVSITVAPVFPRGLAACTSLEPFMPPGARMWGHTMVGVRCIGERPWTLYVQARVAVQVTYYTAARQIGQGETLSAADLQPRDGDLASLPQTVITDRTQALGAVSLARIAAGLPLRTDMLRSASSVVIGQTVKLVADGPNFSISTEGSVLNNAAPGQQVQVRTGGGQIVTGVVKDAGTVQVQI